MNFLNEFTLALEKRREKNKLSFFLVNEDVSKIQLEELTKISIPVNVLNMLISLNGLLIREPRSFELLKFSEMKVVNSRYLLFARMNENQNICFDMHKLNSASEWDIVNYENGFVITKTSSSFLTNKIWAWIDRSRTIWMQEFYR